MSGCSAITRWSESRSGSRNESIPRLCRTLYLTNHLDEPHTFHVLVERDEEVVRWWTSDEISPETTVTVELDSWHWDRGDYVIYASYDDYAATTRKDLSEGEFGDEHACIIVHVRLLEAEQIAVITTAQGKDEYVTEDGTGDDAS